MLKEAPAKEVTVNSCNMCAPLGAALAFKGIKNCTVFAIAGVIIGDHNIFESNTLIVLVHFFEVGIDGDLAGFIFGNLFGHPAGNGENGEAQGQ